MDTAELIEKIEKIKLLYRILIFVGTLSLLCGLYIGLVHIPKSEDIAKFEKKNKGVVVYNQEEDKSFPYYDVGHHSEHWVMDRFEDFNGKLTLKN